jgi:hypothetical protein
MFICYKLTLCDFGVFQILDLDVRTYTLSCVYEQIALKFLGFMCLNLVHIIVMLQLATVPELSRFRVLCRPRQGKVDNRLLPGKTVKVSGKK